MSIPEFGASRSGRGKFSATIARCSQTTVPIVRAGGGRGVILAAATVFPPTCRPSGSANPGPKGRPAGIADKWPARRRCRGRVCLWAGPTLPCLSRRPLGPAQAVTIRCHLPSRSSFAWLQAAAGALLCTGLAATEVREPDTPPEPAAAYQAPTDPSELLKVDEPMRTFFGERILVHRRPADRLRALLRAILKPEGMNFAYEFERTTDARETFRQRRGNCVSFSFLFVALAREFGLDASFQNANTPLKWDRYGNIVVSVRHMNVRVEIGQDVHLVDLQLNEIAGMTLADMPVVGDKRAFAQFYDNMGFFELLHGRRAEALQHMIVATTTDPMCAGAWANRAAMHAHFNHLAEARACYEHALQADPRDLFALEGYVGILQRLGSPEDLRIAAKYERRAQTVRDRNPYYQQRLAERAQERGDWAAAEKLYRRAIALKDTEPEFYEQWGKALTQLGRTDAARRAAVKLEKLRRRLAEAPVHFTP